MIATRALAKSSPCERSPPCACPPGSIDRL